METYIGTKILKGKEMNLGDYNKYRGWTIPENEDPEKEGYLVEYEDGYESWSPSKAFSAYRRTDGMNFGLAIEAMKKGSKVARSGWNGNGMWISLTNGQTIPTEKFWNPNNKEFASTNGGQAEVLPVITMKTADNKVLMGWLASQTDILADDWSIV